MTLEPQPKVASGDSDLLARLRTGDSDAIDRLVDKYQGGLLRFAASLLQDADVAEDVVQETFLKLVRQPPEPERGKELAGWLYTVCRNRAFDVMKKEKRERARRELAAVPEVIGQPTDDLEHLELHGMVGQELAKLPPKQQEVVRLKILEGFSYREISNQTGLKAGYIGWLVHTGLTQLTDRLRAAGAL